MTSTEPIMNTTHGNQGRHQKFVKTENTEGNHDFLS